ncbi:LruC domain-containing protein [Psychromonas marina]|uniref:LruC domain-containing protein n=1 Tax=Psychromonas marina TaxID=88364 RepID=A0ABQ6E235_9GAMM|nr:LruC domain-containing protein [Psychromonas marina]GLS91280.1 LruC domain-containing protein [Psychromonas marina]
MQHYKALGKFGFKSRTLFTACALMAGQSITAVNAAPFSTCPSKAFLFQGKPVASYGVNLVTGSFQLIEDNPGINANINGLGFDEQDRYLYGFNTTDLQVVRMDSDFQVQALNVSGLPADYTFFVGDVSSHHYYLYRKNVGLYKIDLSPLDNDITAALTAQHIGKASVNLTDIAFNPNDNQLYGVDNGTGKLYQISPDTGAAKYIGESGETGTFGAMYFDVNGYFYLSRNQDGKIYRIDLSSVTSNSTIDELQALDVTAIHFADGPSSSQNDGARCASAPLIDEDSPSNIDFGDAPQTYATLLADNGARHLLDGETYLGLTAPDGDYDGYTGADSDDSTLLNDQSFDDEDGVNFVTAFEIGLDSVVTVYASRDGILSAWFDWNRDGDFDDQDEQSLVDIALTEGLNVLSLRVPDGAVAGNSWSRFRFSQQAELNYYGGSSSGEVEDHAFTISESGISYRYYPGENSWVTLAYEDQWPASDDYDMNDVVMYYRTVEVIQDNQVVRIDIKGELQALGGVYHNGFAVQLEDVDTTNVNQQTLRLLHNNIEQQYSGTNGATTYPILETGNSNAVVIISQDLWKQASSVCSYHRTEKGCNQTQSFDFEISVPLINPIEIGTISAPYDPFIFATEGLYHGEMFTSHPGRGLEIHLVDKAPTEKFNSDFYGLADDTSDPSTGRYFRNSNNLPWALEVSGPWKWPSERSPLLNAYPEFQTFVESNGNQGSQWFDLNQAIARHLF